MVFHYVENAFLLSVLKIVPYRASLVPRPVRAIWVTRGGLEPSAIARCVSGEFSRQAWLVTSHPKSPRTTGNKAGTGLLFTQKNGLAARFLWLSEAYTHKTFYDYLILGCRCDRYFWDIRLKIYRLPCFNMLFQLLLTKLFEYELFSCLQKVDHVIN